jgi:DnaJ-class molecular chaperone
MTVAALSLPSCYWPTCEACGGSGRITQRFRLTAGGALLYRERDCALCLGTGRTPWPAPL